MLAGSCTEQMSGRRGARTCSQAWRRTAATLARTADSARCCKALNLPAYAAASAYLAGTAHSQAPASKPHREPLESLRLLRLVALMLSGTHA